MATIASAKESLGKLVLESFFDEYREYTENWRSLETKAQGNIAIAGIFVAGVFAFLTKSGSTPDVYERFFLLIAIFLLIFSVIFAMLVLRTRIVPIPPLGSFMDYSARHLLLLAESEFPERFRRFNSDHTNTWREVISKTTKSLRSKAFYLWIAQVLLMSAIISVAILAVIKVIRI